MGLVLEARLVVLEVELHIQVVFQHGSSILQACRSPPIQTNDLISLPDAKSLIVLTGDNRSTFPQTLHEQAKRLRKRGAPKSDLVPPGVGAMRSGRRHPQQ